MENGIEEPQDFMLYINKRKVVGMLIIMMIFVIVGVWLLKRDPWIGWWTIGFCGLGSVVFIVQLLPGSSFLRIDQDGLLVRNLFKEFRIDFATVKQFVVYDVGGFIPIGRPRMVGMYMVSPTRGTRFARSVTGVDGGLPDTYSMNADELANLLNDRLEIWRRKNLPTPPPQTSVEAKTN